VRVCVSVTAGENVAEARERLASRAAADFRISCERCRPPNSEPDATQAQVQSRRNSDFSARPGQSCVDACRTLCDNLVL
jgi:hypothetical protein